VRIQIDIDHQYHLQLKNILVVDHLLQVDMLYQFEYIVLFDTKYLFIKTKKKFEKLFFTGIVFCLSILFDKGI